MRRGENSNSDSMVPMRAPTEAQLRFAQLRVKRQAAVVKDKIDGLWHQPSSPGNVEGVTGQDLLDSSQEEESEAGWQRCSSSSSRPSVSRGRRALLKVSQRKLRDRRQRIAQQGFHHCICSEEVEEKMREATAIDCFGIAPANSSEKQQKRTISPSCETKPQIRQTRKFEVPSQISFINISQSASTLTPTSPKKILRQSTAIRKFGAKKNNQQDWVNERVRRKEPVHNPVISIKAPLDRTASWLVHLPKKQPKLGRPTTPKRGKQPRERPTDVISAKASNKMVHGNTFASNRTSQQMSLSKLALKKHSVSFGKNHVPSITSMVSSTLPAKKSNNFLDNLVWSAVETDVVRFTVRVEQGLIAAMDAGSSVSFSSMCTSSMEATGDEQESRHLLRTVTYDDETDQTSPTSVSSDAFTAVKRMILEKNVAHYDAEEYQRKLHTEERAIVRLSPCLPVNEAAKPHKSTVSGTSDTLFSEPSIGSLAGGKINSAIRVLDGCIDLLDSKQHKNSDSESVLSCPGPPVHWIQLKEDPDQEYRGTGTATKKIGKVRFEGRKPLPEIYDDSSPSAKQLPTSLTPVNANITLGPGGSVERKTGLGLLDRDCLEEITANELKNQTVEKILHPSFHQQQKPAIVIDSSEDKDTPILSNSDVVRLRESGDETSDLKNLEASDEIDVFMSPQQINDDTPLAFCRNNDEEINSAARQPEDSTRDFHLLSPSKSKFFAASALDCTGTKPEIDRTILPPKGEEQGKLPETRMSGIDEGPILRVTPSADLFSKVCATGELQMDPDSGDNLATEENNDILPDEDNDDIPVPTFSEVRAKVRNTFMESRSRWSAHQKIRHVKSSAFLRKLYSSESNNQGTETQTSLEITDSFHIAQRSKMSSAISCSFGSEPEHVHNCASNFTRNERKSGFFEPSISTDPHSSNLSPSAKKHYDFTQEKPGECCFDRFTPDALHHSLPTCTHMHEQSAGLCPIDGSAKLASIRRKWFIEPLEPEMTVEDLSTGDRLVCALQQEESATSDSIDDSDKFTSQGVVVHTSRIEQVKPDYEQGSDKKGSLTIQGDQRDTESLETVKSCQNLKRAHTIASNNNRNCKIVEPKSSIIPERAKRTSCSASLSAERNSIQCIQFEKTPGASKKIEHSSPNTEPNAMLPSFEGNSPCIFAASFDDGAIVPACCDNMDEKFRKASIDWDMALVETLGDTTADKGKTFDDENSICSDLERIDTASLQRELALSSYDDVSANDYICTVPGSADGTFLNGQEISQKEKRELFYIGAKTNQGIVISLESESAPSISHLLNSYSDCDSSDDSTALANIPAEKNSQACFAEIEMAHWENRHASATSDALDRPRCKAEHVTADVVSAASAGGQEQTNLNVYRRLVLLTSESRWSINIAVDSMLRKVDDFGRKHVQKSGKPKQKSPLSAGCGLSTEQGNLLQMQLMKSRSDGGDAIDFDVRWEKRFMM